MTSLDTLRIDGLSYEIVPTVHSDDLSPRLAEDLVDGTDLRLPWELALALLDWRDADAEYSELIERAHLHSLDPDSRDLLLASLLHTDLPSINPLMLHLKEHGVRGRSTFSIEARWRSAEGDDLSESYETRGGLLVRRDGSRWRLSLGQLRALDALDARRETFGASHQEDIRSVAEVVGGISRVDPGVTLDSFLARELAIWVEAVEPSLNRVRGGYQTRPRHREIPNHVLDEYYYSTPPDEIDKEPVSWGTEEGRREAAFSDRATRGIRRSRELDVIPDDKVPEALSHPEEFFGPDFDLSSLSERITGLGPVVRRSLATLRETKKKLWWEWNADLVIESLESDERFKELDSIDLEDPEIAKSLKDCLDEAEERGYVVIPHPVKDGEFIEVTDRLTRAVEAAIRLQKAAPGGRSDQRPRDVLQVAENLDDLLFDRAETRVLGPEEPASLPQSFTGKMYPHQLEGFSWLRALWDSTNEGPEGWHGALLADDMGLGKTLQVLCLLASLAEEGLYGPHLVVAPVALLDNWRNEARNFFGSALEPIFVARGPKLDEEPAIAARQLEGMQLVITNYATVRNHEYSFARVRWGLVALDEAQKAKDPGSQTARVVRTLMARFRLAVSGTPVENSLRELWTIYDWTLPGLLGSLRDFNREFLNPLNRGDEGTKDALALDLYSRIQPVYQRRMKEEILGDELPILRSVAFRSELSPLQVKHYTRFAKQAEASPNKSIGFLHRLFGVCAHPDLVKKEPSLRPLREEPFEKGQRLHEILDKIHEIGEKVLLFANRRALQTWLASEVRSRYGVPVDIINGEVSGSRARLELVDEFSTRSGFAALVLAPRAAGVGLNITAANHVIHYTREWNPALEKQATDRTYRIGQERDVSVYTITNTSARGATVEERLDELLQEKRALAEHFVIPLGGFEILPEELWRGHRFDEAG